MAKVAIVAGDLHVPFTSPVALELLYKAAEKIKPDLYGFLGDMFSHNNFSRHGASPITAKADIAADLQDHYQEGIDHLDEMEKHCGRTVFVEGNHDAWIERWAANTAQGRTLYSMVSPRLCMSRNRSNFIYIPYYNQNGTYSHYKLSPRLAMVHGWSYSKHATANHLDRSHGMSIIHGHTHRVQYEERANPFSAKSATGMSVGCLCAPVPMWSTSSPVNWVNAFGIVYIGKHSDTMYPVTVNKNFVILPDGSEIKV